MTKKSNTATLSQDVKQSANNTESISEMVARMVAEKLAEIEVKRMTDEALKTTVKEQPTAQPAKPTKEQKEAEKQATLDSMPLVTVKKPAIHWRQNEKGEFESYYVIGDDAGRLLAPLFAKRKGLARERKLEIVPNVGKVQAFTFGKKSWSDIARALNLLK